MVGPRARRLLVWLAAMNVVALNLHDAEAAEAAQEALRAEARAVHQRRPVAEFAGLEEVVVEGDAVLATEVAGLDLTDEPAIAALRAEVEDLLAGAGRAPVPELAAAWRDEAEMLAENADMLRRWIEEEVETAEGDDYQQEQDAAAERERQDEMKAAFAKTPPFFQSMLHVVMTHEIFRQIRGFVQDALFTNLDLLNRIHIATGKASEPTPSRYCRGLATATGEAKAKCRKCLLYYVDRRHTPGVFRNHVENCKGLTVIDVYMYFLALLLGIERCGPRCVRSFARFVWRASACVHACVRACVLGLTETMTLTIRR
jgi:hypothetical protein